MTDFSWNEAIQKMTEDKMNNSGIGKDELGDRLDAGLKGIEDYIEFANARKSFSDVGCYTRWSNLLKDLKAEREDGVNFTKYLRELTLAVWEGSYRTGSPNFELLNSDSGVLTQLDNMVAGIIQERDTLKSDNEALRHKPGINLCSCKSIEDCDANSDAEDEWCRVDYNSGIFEQALQGGNDAE